MRLDLFSRKVSGWAVDENMEEELVHSALQKAIGYNQLGKGGAAGAEHHPL